MPDIRETLAPFATTRDRTSRKPAAVEIATNPSVHITNGTQTIYDDGASAVSVEIWGYSDAATIGSAATPGPSIEVQENKKFTIEWTNHLPAGQETPVKVVVSDGEDQPFLHNVVGNLASDTAGAGDRAEGFAVTHFHGGKTAQLYDGWPEEMMRPQEMGKEPQSHLCQYISDQSPALYWYHDHAMHTTRLNAYAGMAGCWIIRGQAEVDIGLWNADGPEPFGKYDEMVLVLQDRNLAGTYGADGTFAPSGQLLHRAESGYDVNGAPVSRKPVSGEGEGPGQPLEFFGPLTLVNGTLWPRFEKMDAGLYRVRLLNGSNARVYRLHLLKSDPDGNGYTEHPDLVWQIGTDCGLLPEAVPLPNGCLTLAPAERADLLIDFTTHPNSEFILINSAEAPFGGVAVNDPDPAATVKTALDTAKARIILPDGTLPGYDPDIVDDRNPYPEVLKFSIGAVAKSHPNTDTLNTIKANMSTIAKPAFDVERREIIENQSQGPIRTVLLAEKTMADERNMLVHMEVAPDSDIGMMDPLPPLSSNHLLDINGDPSRIVAERFQDPVSFIAKHGSTETWRFINVSGDTHPMHIHLVKFLVRRRVKVTYDYATSGDDTTPIAWIDWDDAVPDGSGVDANEAGFKDTVRVNPREMVEVTMRFDGYCGRYLYHCHILEHEDHDMMRQFIVTRDDDPGHGHMWPIGVGK